MPCYGVVEKDVGLAVKVGAEVALGAVVAVGGTGVSLGKVVDVKGSTVSVNGSVGNGVTVTPGNGVGIGVRVATLGTHRISPGKMLSLTRQLTVIIAPVVT